MVRYFRKGVGYVLAVHVLSVAFMLLRGNRLLSDTGWFACLIALCVLIIPTYFFVKQDPPRKWLYWLASVTSHIICTLLVFSVMGVLLDGWDRSVIYWTEIFLSSSFGITAVIDGIVNVKS